MTLALLLSAYAADARLDWRAGVGRVVVRAPGEHVSPDAPASLRVGELRVELRGDPAALRFPVAPGPVAVELRVALCTDAGTTCRSVVFSAVGAIGAPTGTLRLADGPLPASALAPDAPAPAPLQGSRSGVVKVLDFTAVWCPPCNLLAAEVLHAPDGTAGVPVEPSDVDRVTSWTLKDRYAVGGYPTLVAVDAAGVEIDRLVGYPGAERTRAWFASLMDAEPIETLAARVAAGAPEIAGPAASAAARRLAEAGRADVADDLFPAATDGVDLRVARLLVEPTPADARWLFAHPAPPGDWVFAAIDADASLWDDAVALAPAVSPATGADYLYAAAEHAPPEVAPALRSASLALLRAAQTGEPARDRGHVTFLAQLRAETGDLDGAIALLSDYAARYPDEFTFPHAAAGHLLDAGRLPEAEVRARQALALAWGDQRLRAAATLASVLAARGDEPGAVQVIDTALAEVPAPPPGVEVRTTRYRGKLERLRAELTGE